MVFRTFALLVTMVLGALLGGCGSSPSRAPVIDRLPTQTSVPPAPKPAAKAVTKEPDWRPDAYTVQKGDTLFSIALEHGYDYRDLAEWNGIPAPYVIRVGQMLRLSPPGSEGAVPLKLPGVAEAKPLPATTTSVITEPKALRLPYSDRALAQMEQAPPKVEPAKAASAPPPGKPETAPPADAAKGGDDGSDDPDRVDWTWPAKGKIVANFNDNGSNKGVDIAGTSGQAVMAAAAGKVVHTGTTLRGYGKLIIIKHNKSYFSVYAHNSQILVKEGQTVVRGQKIAEMGDTDADRVELHFEIRRLGKPVDPLKYLPNDRTS